MNDFYEDICSECGEQYLGNTQKICNVGKCRGKIISKQQLRLFSSESSPNSKDLR